MLFPSLYTSRKLFLQGSEIIRMPNELRYWLALRRIEGVGSVVFRTLQETLGSPASVFNTPAEELQKIPGVGIKTARRIVSFKNWEIIDEELDRADKNNVHIVTYLDPLYPSQLLNIHDFPPLIYVRGSLSQEDVRIAVVGSRQASTPWKIHHGKIVPRTGNERRSDRQRNGKGDRYGNTSRSHGGTRQNNCHTGQRPGCHLPAGK